MEEFVTCKAKLRMNTLDSWNWEYMEIRGYYCVPKECETLYKNIVKTSNPINFLLSKNYQLCSTDIILAWISSLNLSF